MTTVRQQDIVDCFTPPAPPTHSQFHWGRRVFFWDTEIVSKDKDSKLSPMRVPTHGAGAFASRLVELAIVDFKGALVVHANLYWPTLQPSFPGVCVAAPFHQRSRCTPPRRLLAQMTAAMPKGSILFDQGTNADRSKFNFLLNDVDPTCPEFVAFMAQGYTTLCTASLVPLDSPFGGALFDGLSHPRQKDQKDQKVKPRSTKTLTAMAKDLLGMKVYADGGVHRRNKNTDEEHTFFTALCHGGLDAYIFVREVFCSARVAVGDCHRRSGALRRLNIPDDSVALRVTAVDDLCDQSGGRFWTNAHHATMPTQKDVRKTWSHEQTAMKFHTAAHDAAVLRSCLVLQGMRWLFWYHTQVLPGGSVNSPPYRSLATGTVRFVRLETDATDAAACVVESDTPVTRQKAPRVASSASLGLGFALLTKHHTDSIVPGTDGVFRLLLMAAARVHTDQEFAPRKPTPWAPNSAMPPLFKLSAVTPSATTISAWPGPAIESNGVLVVVPLHFRWLVTEPPLAKATETSRLLFYLRDALRPEQRWYVPPKAASNHDLVLHYVFCCGSVRAPSRLLKRRLRYMTDQTALQTVASGLAVALCKNCSCTDRSTADATYKRYRDQPATAVMEKTLRVPFARRILSVIHVIVLAMKQAPAAAALVAAIQKVHTRKNI